MDLWVAGCGCGCGFYWVVMCGVRRKLSEPEDGHYRPKHVVIPLLINAIFKPYFIVVFLTEFILTHYSSNKSTNLLKPTGHVMHHQFNIQQLYALPTLYLCVLYLSENK